MQADQETVQGRCACAFSQRVLGDGCRYCQPQEYIDRLHAILEEERSEAAAPVDLPAPLTPFPPDFAQAYWRDRNGSPDL